MTASPRILVVDDDEDIQTLTSTVLLGAGYEVETVSTGTQALDAVRDGIFQLVLLDINMPEMNGWETLRLLRADDSRTELPVVMFSVKGEVRDKVHAMQQGATDYINKPFVVDEMLGRIQRILEPATRST